MKKISEMTDEELLRKDLENRERKRRKNRILNIISLIAIAIAAIAIISFLTDKRIWADLDHTQPEYNEDGTVHDDWADLIKP